MYPHPPLGGPGPPLRLVPGLRNDDGSVISNGWRRVGGIGISDQEALDLLTAQLYAAISFEKGGEPDLEKLKSLFLPQGLLINNNEEHPVIWNPEEFIATYRQQIDGGAVVAFLEKEITGRTGLFGTIAHRRSTYEARFRTADGTFPVKGINSIQYLKTSNAWKVVSILWNDEAEGRPVPEEYF